MLVPVHLNSSAPFEGREGGERTSGNVDEPSERSGLVNRRKGLDSFRAGLSSGQNCAVRVVSGEGEAREGGKPDALCTK